MRVLLLPITLAVGLALSACGVKGPPIAPIRTETPIVHLDCSPYDPECDAVDPEYVPGLDPKKPADAKRIQALKEAYNKKQKR